MVEPPRKPNPGSHRREVVADPRFQGNPGGVIDTGETSSATAMSCESLLSVGR
jgi:hypothetical protein